MPFVQQIVRLAGVIQAYDWGSHTVLAELLDAPSPSAEPQAELWLGAHPRGDAQIETATGERVPLSAWIERDPAGVLGADVALRFGGRLPFLLKVLAVERALSLQAHPDAAQARAGFDREQRAGVALADRLYADAGAKPELIVALTPFHALSGFRPLYAIRAALDHVGLGALVPSHDDGLRAFLASWLAPDPNADRDAALARALAAARPADPAEACMLRLAGEHPGDPGAIAALLLHAIELAPGEGLFLEAGELHCYLGGVATEIMAASDNVLRAGLTRKRRAVDELLRIGRFAPRTPEVLRAVERAPGLRIWETPADAFELAEIDVGRAGIVIAERTGVEILLCLAGMVHVAGAGLTLRRGQSCLVPAAVGGYRLEGTGRLQRAGVPAARGDERTIR